MKKSINAWTVDGAAGFEDMFRQVKEAGFDGIELNVDAPGHSSHSLTLDISDEELERIKSLSATYELPVVSISTSLFQAYLMGSPKEEDRALAKRIILCQLRCAKALGAGGILVVPGGVPQQGSFPKAFETSAATLKELKPDILEYKINVGVENVWNGFFMSPLDMARFIDEVDCPYIGAYYDVGNVIAFSWSEYWIDALGTRIKNIHVKDYKRSAGINSGGEWKDLLQGDVNWEAVVPALKRAGFDGYLTAEVSKEDPAQPFPAYYREVAEAIGKIIAMA